MPLSASILSRLEYQYLSIRELIGDTPEDILRCRIHPDKWSAFENIAHLAAYQPMFLRRLQRMQEESDPEFSRYVAEQDPLFPPMLGKSLDQLLVDIDEKRTTLIIELTTMDDETLERFGIHPKYGRFPIKKWADFFLLHEAHHLYAIFMLVQDVHKTL